ncbi:MAG: hypothetical protein QOK25_1958 [Thermoleophilaceae bacterium]|nr:hypothetical protein [Thermoleophilaceae bacterium]
MIVDRVALRETDIGVERSARVRWRDGHALVRIAAPPELVSDALDASPFVPACLLPAMRRGEDLEIDGPVSPRLVRGCSRARELYRGWAPELTGGELRVGEQAEPVGGGDGVGCFFSRGVDSSYSAAVPRAEADRLTTLVFLDGLEPLHDANVRAEEIRLARETARRVGLPLALATTNLREMTDPIVGDWEDMAGGGLSFAALALAGGLRSVVIPSSDGPMTVGPCGVSPLLDPLFSTEALQVDHDSVAITRVGKVLWLAAERPDLARVLKVCFAEDRADNCGRCPKCLLTMGALEAAGLLSEAEFFPHELDPDAIARLRVSALQARVELAELARALDPGRHRALRDAILHALRQPPRARRGSAPPDHTPGFRRRHDQLVWSLLRDDFASPAMNGAAAGSSLVGLVRVVDPKRRCHVYGAGSVPAGELVGELGALRAVDPGDGVPLSMSPEGFLVSAEHVPAPRPLTVARAARWALAPLSWRDSSEGLGTRVRATLSRTVGLAAARPAAPSGPNGSTLGYLRREAGEGRLPLFSSLHPITGDQLLTTDPSESVYLGYGDPDLLGHIEAEAPLTGSLGTGRPRLPWASRFGQRLPGRG